MNNEELIKNIKQLCKDNDIKISQLESELNFGQGLISRWSKSDPSLSKIIDIADYFHVSVDELVGRNISTNKEDFSNKSFIFILQHLTDIGYLTWEECTSELIVPEHDNKKLFQICEPTYEIFRTKYNNDKSFIFIVADYEINCGHIESCVCNLFIQPDVQSIPVLQPNWTDDDEYKSYKLWLSIHNSLKEEFDNFKAERIKKQIINENEMLILDSLSDILEFDDNVDELLGDQKKMEYLTKSDNPEIKQIIEVFTAPGMVRTLESVSRMIEYLKNIQRLQDGE